MSLILAMTQDRVTGVWHYVTPSEPTLGRVRAAYGVDPAPLSTVDVRA